MTQVVSTHSVCKLKSTYAWLEHEAWNIAVDVQLQDIS